MAPIRLTSNCVDCYEQSNAKLVGLAGVEPATSPLSGVRSNQLSYRPEHIKSGIKFTFVIEDKVNPVD